MKKKFSALTKTERQKIERQYHQMKPEDFDGTMSRAGKSLINRSSTKRKNGTTEKKRAA
jgi:hypothetical protein